MAAYKTVELNGLLGDAPIQHRVVEGHESPKFLSCFHYLKGICYLEDSICSGFCNVSGADSDQESLDKRTPDLLYRVWQRKTNRTTQCIQIDLTTQSLNDGNVFILDIGTDVFMWYGSSTSDFEQNTLAIIVHNMVAERSGHGKCIIDVGEEEEDFWLKLGGRPYDAVMTVILQISSCCQGGQCDQGGGEWEEVPNGRCIEFPCAAVEEGTVLLRHFLCKYSQYGARVGK